MVPQEKKSGKMVLKYPKVIFNNGFIIIIFGFMP